MDEVKLKKCDVCKGRFPLTSFMRGGMDNFCRPCRRIYHKAWLKRKKLKDRWIANDYMRKWKKIKRIKFLEQHGDTPELIAKRAVVKLMKKIENL